jgi:ribonucleoside-triphosphate reductase
MTTIENPQRAALAAFNFAQKYARYLPEHKRRETWSEATARVMTMHRAKLGDRVADLSVELVEIERLINERRILGSQRSLQFGGDAVLAKHARSYNCTSCYVDHVDRFAQALYLLLCGAGVGYSVQKHHVAKLPPILDEDTLADKERVDRCIPDTIEGWADAFKGLVRSYTDPVTPLFAFDFSLIREKGAPISSCGGKAPGPEPLRIALERAEELLASRVGSALRPIDASDLMCILADCVLAGGVRRSALLCMFSPDDEEMIAYKSAPNWWDAYPYRARANISAMILRSDPDARAHFDRIFRATRAYGEPAVIWCDSLEVAYNPCVEIGMCPTLIRDSDGEVVDEYTIDMLEDSRRHAWELDGYTYETAFQFCNLCEINASAWRTIEDAERAVYLATILGMIQATYTGTDGDYLADTATRAILERECLLGVSLTGLGSAPHWARESHMLEHLSTIARRTAEQSWERVGLPRPPARVTCVKPSGNAAVNLGCASGVHPEHSRRYIRRVQAPASSPIVQAFASANPQAVERSVWSASGEDLCLAFAVTAPEDALTRDDLSATEFLAWVRQVQGTWVKRGTLRAQSVERLTHNVSNTCTVGADEWDEVAETLLNGRAEFGGVSLLGASGDYDYPQAPFQAIRFPHEIAEDDPHREAKIEAYNYFCQLEAQFTPIDYSAIIEDDDNTTLMFESACAGGACEI